MVHPVYKLFFYRRNHKGLEMKAPEFEKTTARLSQDSCQLGVRHLLTARMRWSNEANEYFGVELYPNINTVQAYAHCLEEQGWYQLVSGESYLGIPMDGTANGLTPPEPPQPGEDPIYRVYLSRLTDYGHSLSTEELSNVWAAGRESLFRVGGRMLLAGYNRWNNEEWDAFGVERFPNQESVVEYSQFLSLSGWYRVSSARSFLGVGVAGELLEN